MSVRSMRSVRSSSGLSTSPSPDGRSLRRAPIAASIFPLAVAIIVSFGLGAPVAVRAGSMIDFDGDLVPDAFDNCRTVANGPNQSTNQFDSDGDGYGNRCDTDFDQSGTTTTADFAIFLARFGSPICIQIFPPPPSCMPDLDGSGTVTTSDFAIFLGRYSVPPGAPGPSGLVCANPLIRIDLGDTPCAP